MLNHKALRLRRGATQSPVLFTNYRGYLNNTYYKSGIEDVKEKEKEIKTKTEINTICWHHSEFYKIEHDVKYMADSLDEEFEKCTLE